MAHHPGRVGVTSILVASAGWRLGVLVQELAPLGASGLQRHVVHSAFHEAGSSESPSGGGRRSAMRP